MRVVIPHSARVTLSEHFCMNERSIAFAIWSTSIAIVSMIALLFLSAIEDGSSPKSIASRVSLLIGLLLMLILLIRSTKRMQLRLGKQRPAFDWSMCFLGGTASIISIFFTVGYSDIALNPAIVLFAILMASPPVIYVLWRRHLSQKRNFPPSK